MQPYPHIMICTVFDDPDSDCQTEHNPLPGYEDHHYGCECDGCIEWYRTLK